MMPSITEATLLFSAYKAAQTKRDVANMARLQDSWLTSATFTREELDQLLAIASTYGTPQPITHLIPNHLSGSDRTTFDTAVNMGYEEFEPYMQAMIPSTLTFAELCTKLADAKACIAAGPR